ncbi:putative lipase atg15 [Steccherinum ochraceum]|uniref:triacylglycerol lipase n=1 Tax=Steccherinum ochraceum TaxID=92696 RepID=A0A4R0RK36_9APHY|nr:putative lipase atg15 [Steccherinum ochraceum]
MYSGYQLDNPPPPSQFRRPWSPDPYDPLPATSSYIPQPQAHNQRREPSDVSVEALDLADYARTLAMRTAEHIDPSHPYNIPAYRSYEHHYASPAPAAGGFRSIGLASHESFSPPSLTSGTTSRTPTVATSRGGPRHRPFSLPPSSYPPLPPALHSLPSQSSRSNAHTSVPGAPQSEVDITQFPSFARGWYANQPKPGTKYPQDPFSSSQPNVFDPAFPTDTYRSDSFDGPHLGYYSPPPSYPSHGPASSRDYLPWSGDPPETNGPLDADVKEERMRMLEREFGGKGKGVNEEEHVVGSVDSRGKLITEGSKKRLAVRWLEVLLALLAGGSSIYAGLAIKPNPPAPPAGKAPLYILYVASVISFLLSTYMFLIRPCCSGRRPNKNTPFTQGPGGMMVLPVQGLPGGKKKGGKKKGQPGGDVQVNLIVDPSMFGQSRRDDAEEEDDDDEVMSVPGTYTTSSARKRKHGPKRRSVFDGLALEAQWKEARKWLKWGMFVDVLSLVLWGAMFVFIMLGKRCPSGQFEGCGLPAAPGPEDLSVTLSPSHEYALSNDYDLADSESIFSIRHALPGSRHDPSLTSDGQSLLPTSTHYTLRARPTTVHRPRSNEVYQAARLRSLHHLESQKIDWEVVDVLGPDVEDQHTLGQLARMTGNAYAKPGQKNWYDLDGAWNTSFPFGWEDPKEGFRGHVFLSPDNNTVILSIKGTTLQGPTSKKDKFNDNLMFSCCCARVDFSWIFSTVCNCYANNWRCDIQDSLFYNVGVNLINNLTMTFPTSTIWLVGHSLGGALASLLGTTFGLPAVAFEAPGERLAAHRLHLPLPPAHNASLPSIALAPVTHVYHTADPIPQGACTGVGSPCASAGYALETRCHLGKSIVYDTVTKLGWRVDVRKHPIREVILNVIEEEVPKGGWDYDWECEESEEEKECGGERRVGRAVPVPRPELDCTDCYKWEFGEFKDHK